MQKISTILLTVAFTALFLTSCSSGSTGECQLTEIIYPNIESKLLEPHTLVIRDTATWDNFIDSPGEEIDFENEMVIVICLGMRPSGGYLVEIDCVRFMVNDPLTDRVIIEFTEQTPGNKFVTQQLTYPHQIVKVARFDGEDVFERTIK